MKEPREEFTLLRGDVPSLISLTVADERGHNHHNDNYVGKCGYADGEERERERGEERDRRSQERERKDPIPPPTSCLIRSFANYRRKHRVNYYTPLAAFSLAQRLFDRSCFAPRLLLLAPLILAARPLPFSRVEELLRLPLVVSRLCGSVTWDTTCLASRAIASRTIQRYRLQFQTFEIYRSNLR